jgi:hypothetical protein
MSVRVIVGSAALVFIALQSCTAVLGMERATLEVSTDGSAGGSGNAPNTSHPKTHFCKEPPTSDCTTCLRQNCPSDYDNCINDVDCRAKLDAYALCLGNTCLVRTLEDCGNENLDPTLAYCAATCTRDCTGTTLVDPCTLYCACMPTCATGVYAQTHPEAPAVTGNPCLDKCRSDNKPALAECQRKHCDFAAIAEAASDDDYWLMHCEHATGVPQPVCPDTPPNPSRLCLGLSESGWPCDKLSQCCSNRCNSNVCD